MPCRRSEPEAASGEAGPTWTAGLGCKRQKPSAAVVLPSCRTLSRAILSLFSSSVAWWYQQLPISPAPPIPRIPTVNSFEPHLYFGVYLHSANASLAAHTELHRYQIPDPNQGGNVIPESCQLTFPPRAASPCLCNAASKEQNALGLRCTSLSKREFPPLAKTLQGLGGFHRHLIHFRF